MKALLAVVVMVVLGGFGVFAWIVTRPVPAPVAASVVAPPARVPVLVAARPVQAGTLLKPDDIAVLELPADALPDGAQPESAVARLDLVGAMARRPLRAHQPLLATDLLRPTDGGFLAAVLAPEHRAVSVAVDAVSGTAGLIWPGDRVDLILTQATDEATVPPGRRTFGETVLHDLRVIAVDQQLSRGVSPEGAAQPNRTVTLEVTPEAAERVAVAVRLGRVALSVRAAAGSRPIETDGEAPRPAMLQAVSLGSPKRAGPAPDPPAGPTTGPTTWGQDVSPALNQRPRPSQGTTMRVFQGAANEKEFKFE